MCTFLSRCITSNQGYISEHFTPLLYYKLYNGSIYIPSVSSSSFPSVLPSSESIAFSFKMSSCSLLPNLSLCNRPPVRTCAFIMNINVFQNSVPKEWFSVGLNCQKAEVWFSEHSPSSLALQNSAAFPLKTWLCQVGRAPQPSAPHHPDDRSFQQVSRCHEEAEKVILLLSQMKPEICLYWDVPGYAL